MDECLYAGLVEMAQVGGGLAGFLPEHEGMWVDEAERVDNDLALYGLDGVDDDGDGARSELFEGLLGVDVDGREPAAETWMGMVPADYSLGSVRCQYRPRIVLGCVFSPSGLLQHVHHLGLKDWIYSFD